MLSLIVSHVPQLTRSHLEWITGNGGDEDVQEYPIAITNLQLKNILVYPNGPGLLCDISAGLPRPVVPSAFRRQVLDIMHNSAYLGAKECFGCQRYKIQRHIHTPLETFDVPEQRFSHIRVDLVGPLPPSSGFTYLFPINDRYTLFFYPLLFMGYLCEELL